MSAIAQHQHLLSCEACGARVPALRRGRCTFCYLQWTETRPVGLGAACLICGERRRDDLRSVEFQRKWLPMCHSCATKMLRMQPLPHTIEAVRQRLSRDRRWQERRVGRSDKRFYRGNRRAGERRSDTLDEQPNDYLDATALIIEILDDATCSDDGCTCHRPGDSTRIVCGEPRPPRAQRVEVTGPQPSRSGFEV